MRRMDYYIRYIAGGIIILLIFGGMFLFGPKNKNKVDTVSKATDKEYNEGKKDKKIEKSNKEKLAKNDEKIDANSSASKKEWEKKEEREGKQNIDKNKKTRTQKTDSISGASKGNKDYRASNIRTNSNRIDTVSSASKNSYDGINRNNRVKNIENKGNGIIDNRNIKTDIVTSASKNYSNNKPNYVVEKTRNIEGAIELQNSDNLSKKLEKEDDSNLSYCQLLALEIGESKELNYKTEEERIESELKCENKLKEIKTLEKKKDEPDNSKDKKDEVIKKPDSSDNEKDEVIKKPDSSDNKKDEVVIKPNPPKEKEEVDAVSGATED